MLVKAPETTHTRVLNLTSMPIWQLLNDLPAGTAGLKTIAGT